MSEEKRYSAAQFICSGIREREDQKFELTYLDEMAIRIVCYEEDGSKKNLPKITNYNIIDTNEHEHIFQSNVKEFRIRSKQAARMNIAYEAGETLDGDNNWHVSLGGVYEEGNLKAPNDLTIYFRLDRINRDVQIIEWT